MQRAGRPLNETQRAMFEKLGKELGQQMLFESGTFEAKPLPKGGIFDEGQMQGRLFSRRKGESEGQFDLFESSTPEENWLYERGFEGQEDGVLYSAQRAGSGQVIPEHTPECLSVAAD